jgi:uncharacterized membrane-anchored protein
MNRYCGKMVSGLVLAGHFFSLLHGMETSREALSLLSFRSLYSGLKYEVKKVQRIQQKLKREVRKIKKEQGYNELVVGAVQRDVRELKEALRKLEKKTQRYLYEHVSHKITLLEASLQKRIEAIDYQIVAFYALYRARAKEAEEVDSLSSFTLSPDEPSEDEESQEGGRFILELYSDEEA